MRKIVAVSALALMLGACTRPLPDTRSEILDWAVPNSLPPENTSAQESMRKMADIHNFTCGPNESFQISNQDRFNQEFKKMLISKGYEQTVIMDDENGKVVGLTGPKPIMAILLPGSFTLCEVREKQ